MIQIRDGILYDGNRPITPQFGNRDHIQAVQSKVREIEEIEKALNGEDNEEYPGKQLYIETGEMTIEVYTSFKCGCGKNIFMEDEIFDMRNEDDAVEIFIKQRNKTQKVCGNCQAEYSITAETDRLGQNQLYYKLTKKGKP